MTAEIHDMVAAGDKVAIRATYRGTDEGGFIPNMPATGKTFEMEAMYIVRVNDEGQIAEHWGVVDTIGTMGQLGLLPPQSEKSRAGRPSSPPSMPGPSRQPRALSSNAQRAFR